jgi:hypothetical protein
MSATRPARVPALLCCLLAAALAVAAAAPKSAAAQQAAPPTIVGIGVVGCVNFGDRIAVRGSGFGRAGGRALMLRDPNVGVELPVSNWTDRSIVATVPKHRQLGRGKWYVLGIQEVRSGTWLSGQGRPVQICDDEAVSLGAEPPSRPEPRQPDPRRPAQQPERLPPAPGATPPLPAPPPTAAVDADREPDEVLAIAASLADATTLAQQVTNLGYAVRSLQDLPTLGFALLRLGLPAGLDVPGALNALRLSFPATLFDANTLYEPDAASDTAGEPRHFAKALIGWPEAAPGCAASVSIGLIDTALDRGHSAFAGRQVTDRSFIAAGVPPAPPDHGTAVAALLVGAPGSTASGLLPAARLYAAAIFALRDDRVVGTTDAIARAVDWLGHQGVRVVNLSLSGPGNQVMRLTVERAHAGGMLLVAAAGNNGPNAAPVFPAGYPAVMAVTAVDASLQAYSNANRGGYIDLAAPGVDIWSARQGQGGRYNTGTSFAAPFVSAAAALTLSQTPDAAPETIRRGLQDRARDLGRPGRDDTFGRGLLQPPGGC